MTAIHGRPLAEGEFTLHKRVDVVNKLPAVIHQVLQQPQIPVQASVVQEQVVPAAVVNFDHVIKVQAPEETPSILDANEMVTSTPIVPAARQPKFEVPFEVPATSTLAVQDLLATPTTSLAHKPAVVRPILNAPILNMPSLMDMEPTKAPERPPPPKVVQQQPAAKVIDAPPEPSLDDGEHELDPETGLWKKIQQLPKPMMVEKKLPILANDVVTMEAAEDDLSPIRVTRSKVESSVEDQIQILRQDSVAKTEADKSFDDLLLNSPPKAADNMSKESPKKIVLETETPTKEPVLDAALDDSEDKSPRRRGRSQNAVQVQTTTPATSRTTSTSGVPSKTPEQSPAASANQTNKKKRGRPKRIELNADDNIANTNTDAVVKKDSSADKDSDKETTTAQAPTTSTSKLLKQKGVTINKDGKVMIPSHKISLPRELCQIVEGKKGKKLYQCQICTKEFNRKDIINYHVYNEHREEFLEYGKGLPEVLTREEDDDDNTSKAKGSSNNATAAVFKRIFKSKLATNVKDADRIRKGQVDIQIKAKGE
jgi:hypothetical protein